eukprot:GHRR01020138.1.p1 GENE.GHRR01020138.1~~GHRR01020138.1.p1  ORF type:complete len:540 (+),score=220.55 GHRR01020138.1:357-1976(+)
MQHLAGMEYCLEVVPPSPSTPGPHTWGTSGASDAATPGAAGLNLGAAAPFDSHQAALQDSAWWEASGLDPSGLLLKYSIPLSATVVARHESVLSFSGKRMPGSARASIEQGSRPNSAFAARITSISDSRPSSANTPSSANRPSSAAAAAAGVLDAGQPSSRPALAQASRHSSRAIRTPLLGRSSGGSRGVSAAGGGSASSEGVTDEQLLARLLGAQSSQEVAAAFSQLGHRHAASVMCLLAGMPKGPAAVAALLQCLSPIVAVRFLQATGNQQSVLLPPHVRTQVQPLLRPALQESLQEVGAAIREAARVRHSRQLLLIRKFARQVSGVTCSQVVTFLQLLAVQGQTQRCAAVVALWTKVLDRSRLIEVFEALSGQEQLDLMAALGSYYVWSTLARPEGLHFKLDLTQPQQKDVAKAVLKVAVRKSLAERAAAGVRGKQLVNFTAEGKPVQDPEDEKLWLSMESKHTLLEFDFARTWEQELHHMLGAVKRIQRAWRKRTARKAMSVSGTGGSKFGSANGSNSRLQTSSAASSFFAPVVE